MKRIMRDGAIRAIARESWAVSWPTTFIMFYEFLIGLADVYVAGKFGKSAQAAYGFSFQLYFIFIIIGIALSIGTVSVVSRLFTSGKSGEFRVAVSSAILNSAVCGALFVAAGLMFSGRLVSCVGLPVDMKELVAPFMKIYCVAFVFDYVLMTNNGILRACGMVKKSLWIMSAVCVMNIALNFTLAFHSPLGLKGIAAATVISVSAGALMTVYFTGRLAAVFRFSMKVVREILHISWPSCLLQVSIQTGYLVLFLMLGALPARNTEIMAALTNGLKIEAAMFMPAIAFNMGSAVIVGNLIGRGDARGAFSGGIITAVMGVAIVSVITLSVIFNAGHIASFLSNNPLVAEESRRYIHVALIAEPFLAWGIILGGGLNGAGDTRSVMLISFIGIWLIRIPLCYILGIHFSLGAVSIWWAMNISILAQAALMTRHYLARRWLSRAFAAQARL
ncbi:MAG: MATE family efflux transporter [Candidatus Omnitrophota bacterium]